MPSWLPRLTPAEAAQSGVGGHYVLNGAAGSPATRVLEDERGAEVKARSRREAVDALRRAGYRYPDVDLQEHVFPDSITGGTHRIKVWVPGNRVISAADLADSPVADGGFGPSVGGPRGTSPFLPLLVAGALGFALAWLARQRRG